MPDTPNEKTVYVTRWALTAGVLEFAPGLGGFTDDSRYFSTNGKSREYPGMFVGPTDWTCDREEAVKRFHDMVARKLKSLEKQKAKLAKMLDSAPKYVTVQS
jgi:hypothetical protein